jgi:hypothetical protein
MSIRIKTLVSAVALMAGSMLASGPVRGEPDVLMRAVGFALTGSDDAEPKAIDRANCVFAIKNDMFRLNNVHTDRIVIRTWKNTSGGSWVLVALHGDSTVYEHTEEPLKDDGSSFMNFVRQNSPGAFKPQRTTHKEHELTLSTPDQDRVTRAWQYIYSHGCVGKKSPF